MALRLYIKKYSDVNISHNKIHAFLLSKGIAKEDPKKKRQRKYCRYEREHSFSLVHMDWHESDVIPGKQVCVVEDDASRQIIVGGEFDDSLAENNMNLIKQAAEMCVVFAVRTTKPFFKSIPSRLLILATIGATMIALAVIFPPLAPLFEFASLSPQLILLVFMIVFAYVAVVEIAKHFFYPKIENHNPVHSSNHKNHHV